MKKEKLMFVPGLRIDRYLPNEDPQQHAIPHINRVLVISKDGKSVSDRDYIPNPFRYEDLHLAIQKYIDDNKLNKKKKKKKSKKSKS